jgi:hypothetical protein
MSTEPPAEQQPTYQGNRFPWWLAAFWIGFLLWGVLYTLTFMLPDFQLWLTQASHEIWK